MIKLQTMADLAKALGVTKQAVSLAVKDNRIEQPKYILGIAKGWTPEQVERIKSTYTRRAL